MIFLFLNGMVLNNKDEAGITASKKLIIFLKNVTQENSELNLSDFLALAQTAWTKKILEQYPDIYFNSK